MSFKERECAVLHALARIGKPVTLHELQSELADLENKIAAARRFYNATVYRYNSRAQSFPDLVLARIAGFREREFFELDDVEARQAPSIDLGPAQ